MIVKLNIGDGFHEEACTSLLEVEGDDTEKFAADWDKARGDVYESDMPSTDAILDAMGKLGWKIEALDIDLEVADP